MLWVSMRRFGTGLIGLATLLVFGRQVLVGQQPAPLANGNVYVNPFAGTGQPAGAPSAARLGYGSGAPGSLAPGGGYGSLAASYANPNLGYGALNNSSNNNSGSGASGGGYGMYGTQWMMNPYQGYLSGVADVTRAQSDYQQGIQQAKLSRQDVIRSSIQTRRAMIEEQEWERAHMPDPEKIRQAALERELNRARTSPPLNDIWSARALNALLRHLITQQGQGARGLRIPLREDTLEHINLTVGDSRSNVGLLKDGGNLQWPLPLQREMFKNARASVNSLMQTAYRSAAGGSKPDSATTADLRANYENLKNTLASSVDQLTPDEYIEANNYLKHVDQTIAALRSANVVKFFDGRWKLKAQDVSELVKFMSEQGLWFAEARPKDEAAYVSLYNSLVSFDRSMQRVPRDSNDSEK
ncbi:MAG: hypothetical protein ACYC3I_04805 [Gemmataceae bacterium]